jgi:hypothetical protein
MALTPEKQEDIARHVTYELRMLATAADHSLPRPNRPTYSGFLENAIVESFLVHARLLDELIGAKTRGPRERDVRARDFRPDWQRRYVLTPDERDGIDGKVIHLAEDRVEQFPWWPGDILVRFVDVFDVFVKGDEECERLFAAALAEARAAAQPFELATRVHTTTTAVAHATSPHDV